jgi:hypothetical protein
MDRKKYVMIFTSFDAKFNFTQTLSRYFLHCDTFLLLKTGLKSTSKKLLDFEQSSGIIFKLPKTNQNNGRLFSH